MTQLYDFGTDAAFISANERRAVAWPVAVWSCYIPENETQNINILEHLILQLVNKNFTDPKSILCGQVGFNKDLVDAAIEACRDKGYFDGRYKELKLSADGESAVGKYDNPYESDLNISKNSKKIYMIQDLVTRNIVPVFDLYRLPEFYIEDESVLVIPYDGIDGRKPKSSSVRTALRYWARLCSNRRIGIEPGVKGIDMSQPPAKEDLKTDELFFEDEVSWESVAAAVDREEDTVVTLAEKEEEKQQEKADREVKNITILDDSPDIYYARGFIAINRNAPDEILVISPFGDRLNDWYRTLVTRLRFGNEDFEEEIQFFLEEKKEELKDLIPLGSQLEREIELFIEYPRVCNSDEFYVLKKQIMSLAESKRRFEQGENDTKNFAWSIRDAYQALLNGVILKNQHLLQYTSMEFSAYQSDLRMLVSSYDMFNDDIEREYKSIHMYKNMTNASNTDGYATSYMSLLLMDAWNDKNGKSMELLRLRNDLPLIIKKRASTTIAERARNDGNKFHMFTGTYDVKEVENQYQEFEAIFRLVYNMFMEHSC